MFPFSLARSSRSFLTLAACLTAAGLCAQATGALAQEAPMTMEANPVPGAHGLRLPATFTGTLPCADCEGIAHHLDLWPNQAYHLRREWLGREGDNVRDEIGRWYADPSHQAIVLYGAGEAPIQWEVKGPEIVRLLDMDGNPIESSLPYELTSAGTLTPTPLTGTFLSGMFRYMADAPSFEECLTGQSFPVAQEGDYLALEQAYSEAVSEGGAPLFARFEGGIAVRPAMEGPDRATAIVERFIAVDPGRECERDVSAPELINTYWRIDSIGGTQVGDENARQEPHLVLMPVPGDPRYHATIGCNQINGGYTLDEEALTLAPGPMTRMACPTPLDALEQDLVAALEMVASWQIDGETLELRSEAGETVASFSAVYTR